MFRTNELLVYRYVRTCITSRKGQIRARLSFLWHSGVVPRVDLKYQEGRVRRLSVLAEFVMSLFCLIMSLCCHSSCPPGVHVRYRLHTDRPRAVGFHWQKQPGEIGWSWSDLLSGARALHQTYDSAWQGEKSPFSPLCLHVGIDEYGSLLRRLPILDGSVIIA